jgi:hypothetical protein
VTGLTPFSASTRRLAAAMETTISTAVTADARILEPSDTIRVYARCARCSHRLVARCGGVRAASCTGAFA